MYVYKIRVYVCMYVCVYVCTHTRAQTHTDAYTLTLSRERARALSLSLSHSLSLSLSLAPPLSLSRARALSLTQVLYGMPRTKSGQHCCRVMTAQMIACVYVEMMLTRAQSKDIGEMFCQCRGRLMGRRLRLAAATVLCVYGNPTARLSGAQ
jgi:hypothetical protein